MRVDMAEPRRTNRPVAVCSGDLLSRTRHEVPPHQHRLLERDAADEERAGPLPNRERDLVSADAEISQVAWLDDDVVDEAGATEHHEGVLVVRAEWNRRPARTEVEVDADMVGVAPSGRGEIIDGTDHDGGDRVIELEPWEVGVMFEGGGSVPGVGRLGDPELHAVQVAAVSAGALFGVGDAATSGHEVELAGRDHLLGAE